jgi:hypothetical protein
MRLVIEAVLILVIGLVGASVIERTDYVRLVFIAVPQDIQAVVGILDVRHVGIGFIATMLNFGTQVLKRLFYPIKSASHEISVEFVGPFPLLSSSGSFATLTAMRLASSKVSTFAMSACSRVSRA